MALSGNRFGGRPTPAGSYSVPQLPIGTATPQLVILPRTRRPGKPGSRTPCQRKAACRANLAINILRRAAESLFSGPIRTSSASYESATIRPVSSGNRSNGNRSSTAQKYRSHHSRYPCHFPSVSKSERDDLHSTIQISYFGPKAMTSTRSPVVGVSSSTLTKSWLSKCRHTPLARSWPGFNAVSFASTTIP